MVILSKVGSILWHMDEEYPPLTWRGIKLTFSFLEDQLGFGATIK